MAGKRKSARKTKPGRKPKRRKSKRSRIKPPYKGRWSVLYHGGHRRIIEVPASGKLPDYPYHITELQSARRVKKRKKRKKVKRRLGLKSQSPQKRAAHRRQHEQIMARISADRETFISNQMRSGHTRKQAEDQYEYYRMTI